MRLKFALIALATLGGAALPAGFAFCGKCGMPLKKDTCSQCGAALIEGFEFCGRCGAKVVP